MSIQEKESIVNIFSSIVITGGFSWYVYSKHMQGAYDLTSDIKQWGILFLYFMGVQIVARIVIYILFYIGNTIVTQREEKNINDERARLIKLLGIRNAHYTFFGTMLITVILLALGMPIYGIFIAWVISSLLSELMENGSVLFFNRKGV